MTSSSGKGTRSTHRKRDICLLAVGGVLLILAIAIVLYSLDYYHATKAALDLVASPGVLNVDGGWAVGDPGSRTGFIFYPGGKVEAKAYLSLLKRISNKGVFCVLCEMPLNLAVLDINAAGRRMKQFPGIKSWFIGGHSLGGSMAAQYATSHPEEVSGLVLLAAYSPSEIPDRMPALLLYGSEDEVMNRYKYAQALSLLSDYTEVVIPGGNHAGFGDYGAQVGDGQATIASEVQQTKTATEVISFMKRINSEF